MEQLTQVAEITVSYTPRTCMPQIVRSEDAHRELRNFFPEELIHLQEQFVVMYLNAARRTLGIYRLYIGGITGNHVADPCLILGTALKVAATAIIISHNHPSGNLQPSRQDEELTAKIKQACKLMDIYLAVHVIVSPKEGEYFSFAD